MTSPTARITAALILPALLAGVAGCGASDSRPSSAASASASPSPSVTDSSGARTRLSGLTPATGEPDVPGLASVHPSPGSVAHVVGPFDDRFRWSRLAFSDGRLRGALRVTSDVSDILELQVLAGFYDRQGTLLGTRRFVHHAELHDEAVGHTPNEREAFTLTVPAKYAASAVSAAVAVPVLVNE